MRVFRDDVAVIGAGAMGTGIAQVAAQAGHRVHLVDVRPGAARQARESLDGTWQMLVGKGRMDPADAEAALARVHAVESAAEHGDVGGAGSALDGLPPCGLVVEAVREDLATKRELFSSLAATQPADTILASNTSSLDITAIADGLPHPERVIGLHFFNPPPLMRLVEVVRGAGSGPEVLDTATELMRQWGKSPVRCASSPGFIVNRVARPFYGEAQRMVADGIADAATIDLALREHAGFRMGPMELTDLIGQDVNLDVGTSVWEQTGRDPRYEPTDFQRDLVAAGRLGRKTGRGVFTYDASGHPLDAAPDPARARELVSGPVTTNPVARTLAMLVNEAVDLVHRGEATAEDVDTAMRLGTNYPRGPFEWADQLGHAVVAAQLAELDAAYPGGRYRPSPALLEQVR